MQYHQSKSLWAPQIASGLLYSLVVANLRHCDSECELERCQSLTYQDPTLWTLISMLFRGCLDWLRNPPRTFRIWPRSAQPERLDHSLSCEIECGFRWCVLQYKAPVTIHNSLSIDIAFSAKYRQSAAAGFRAEYACCCCGWPQLNPLLYSLLR